ncbi:abscisate beta-glucosyltransferase-like [Camellia sinensis]|uniref:abscisate beta-glucosyltransferase-like n=1 Tax=Camellia sinensis TaxID=4442 RepID=UPI001036735D|nr:abscisate beta-glucosyltransferase-like [Camellia sinensis]
MQEAESKTYGVIVNSFYDLEPAYAKYFKNEVGKKLWLAGPVCLFNKENEQKTERGEKNSIDGGTVLNWLNSKEPKSVLYVSFGSQVRMAPEQFLEIAHGLEISGCPFIWVARDMLEYGDDEKNNEGREGRGGKKRPDGFEERMMKSGKGLIVRSWAPQLLILEHQAIGGFLTHCGWNSAIEGIGAGVPMITWPITAEHFFIESLVIDVLKTGIRVGNEEWMWLFWEPKVTVTRDKVKEAVKWLMGGGGGDEAEKMRIRAKEFGEKAKKAVDYGGSSHADVIALINDLKSGRSA